MVLSIAFFVTLFVPLPVIPLVIVLIAEFIAVAAIRMLVAGSIMPFPARLAIPLAIFGAVAEALVETRTASFKALIVLPIMM